MEMRWISVDEDLPIAGMRCIFLVNECEMEVGFRSGEDGSWRIGKLGDVSRPVDTLARVTHWMPRPDLPVEPYRISRESLAQIAAEAAHVLDKKEPIRRKAVELMGAIGHGRQVIIKGQ